MILPYTIAAINTNISNELFSYKKKAEQLLEKKSEG